MDIMKMFGGVFGGTRGGGGAPGKTPTSPDPTPAPLSKSETSPVSLNRSTEPPAFMRKALVNPVVRSESVIFRQKANAASGQPDRSRWSNRLSLAADISVGVIEEKTFVKVGLRAAGI